MHKQTIYICGKSLIIFNFILSESLSSHLDMLKCPGLVNKATMKSYSLVLSSYLLPKPQVAVSIKRKLNKFSECSFSCKITHCPPSCEILVCCPWSIIGTPLLSKLEKMAKLANASARREKRSLSIVAVSWFISSSRYHVQCAVENVETP